MTNESKKEGKLEGFKAITGLIAGVFIPAVVLLVGNSFSEALKERDRNAQYVGFAVQVLQQEPSANNENIRNWAIEVITRFSIVPFNDAVKTELKKFRILPQMEFRPVVLDAKTLEAIKKVSPDLQKR